MRGGFVACLGGDPAALERVAAHTLRPRTRGTQRDARGLHVVAFGDNGAQPAWESVDGAVALVHGDAPAPIRELERVGRRFAAVEWDGTRLRASRDPLGLAPLFYRIFRGTLWLSTEVMPLVALGDAGADLDALSAKAAFAPLDERTGWHGIHRVVPGATLEIEAGTLTVRDTVYWDPHRLLGTYGGDDAESVAEFRRRFDDAVRRCLAPRSAILLSGGLDSTAVALAGRNRRDLELVHVHFPQSFRSHEERYARVVADAVGAPLHLVPGTVSPWDVDAELDAHAIPYNWLPLGLAEPALAHVRSLGLTTALDGHDGDGVLGIPGNGVWGSLLLAGAYRRLGRLWRRDGARRVLRGLAADFVPPRLKPARYRSLSAMQVLSRYFGEPLRTRILEGDALRWRWPPRRWEARQIQPVLPRALASFEQKEIEAARHGIDLRHPFADRDLVEFLVSLPSAIKSDPVRPKRLLVEALEDACPQVMQRADKTAYLDVAEHRFDAQACLDVIRGSRVRLPHLDYDRLVEDAGTDARSIPFFFLVNLARAQRFADRAARVAQMHSTS